MLIVKSVMRSSRQFHFVQAHPASSISLEWKVRLLFLALWGSFAGIAFSSRSRGVSVPAFCWRVHWGPSGDKGWLAAPFGSVYTMPSHPHHEPSTPQVVVTFALPSLAPGVCVPHFSGSVGRVHSSAAGRQLSSPGDAAFYLSWGVTGQLNWRLEGVDRI